MSGMCQHQTRAPWKRVIRSPRRRQADHLIALLESGINAHNFVTVHNGLNTQT
jgi:hypothetical protein